MGNCCRRESSSVWASLDEWYEISPRKKGNENTALLVKMKMTKEQLEELVATARAQDIPVDRLLINAVYQPHLQLQRRPSWEPSLHTISE